MVVHRSESLIGFFARCRVELDGVEVARISEGDHWVGRVAPGPHTLTARLGGGRHPATVSFEAVAGATISLRVAPFGTSGELDLWDEDQRPAQGPGPGGRPRLPMPLRDALVSMTRVNLLLLGVTAALHPLAARSAIWESPLLASAPAALVIVWWGRPVANGGRAVVIGAGIAFAGSLGHVPLGDLPKDLATACVAALSGWVAAVAFALATRTWPPQHGST